MVWRWRSRRTDADGVSVTIPHSLAVQLRARAAAPLQTQVVAILEAELSRGTAAAPVSPFWVGHDDANEAALEQRLRERVRTRRAREDAT